MKNTETSAAQRWRRGAFVLGVAAALLGVLEGCGHPLPPKPPEPSADCLNWSKIQQPLAHLGLEALRLGRIDPDLYELAPGGSTLRVVNSLIAEEGDRAVPLQQALQRVNDDPTANEALKAAFSKVRKAGAAACPPTTYAANVTAQPATEPGVAVYKWSFEGSAPTEAQMKGCFLQLYSAAPAGCPLIPLVELANACLQEGSAPYDASRPSEASAPMSLDKDEIKAFKCVGCSVCQHPGKPLGAGCATCSS